MGEMKSARDIAMEKAGRLDKLTPEELQKRKQEDIELHGHGLATKYIDGASIKELEDNLLRLEAEGKKGVVNAAISKLVESITFQEENTTERCIKAIVHLIHEEEAKAAMDQLKELLSQYVSAKSKKLQEIDASGRNMLHQRRISGSAIGSFNWKLNPEWKSIMEELELPYQNNLDVLKQQVLRHL
ncbi:MAG: hypothetical protein SVY53_04080 [Chloroflexota bacterium]|nr:hypothetical protein [Chloroflexota bacterium]